MNQFHTPSFGDEVFEMNETPMEQTQHQTAVSPNCEQERLLGELQLPAANAPKTCPVCFVNIANAYANILRKESKAVFKLFIALFLPLK